MEKLVSIILPTYNGASRGFLADAIKSVLNQTYKKFELLIIDDGSTDNTKELCANYPDPRVKYFYQENTGVSVARNNGIQKSSGEFICFLDDDDMWLEEKLEKQIKLSQKKDFGLSFTSLEIISQDGQRTGAVGGKNATGNVFEEMLVANLVNCTSSVMVPRGVLEEIGFFKEHLAYAEDYDLWLRIAKKYPLHSIPEVLVLYRKHENNVSKKLDKIDFYAFVVVMEALFDSPSIDQDHILHGFYLRRARYRFWLGDYKVYRKYIKLASAYQTVPLLPRLRFFISYFPKLIKFLKSARRFLQKR